MIAPLDKPAARHAAERFIEAALRDAQHAYGDDIEAWATALAAAFPRVWWDYDGPDRRLTLVGPWEHDPDASDPGR